MTRLPGDPQRSVARDFCPNTLKGCKMLKHVVLLLALLQMPVVFADETSQAKSTSPDEMAKLIDRIDQLEKRIKEESIIPKVHIRR